VIWLIALLFAYGAALELAGFLTILFDLQDAEKTAKRIADEANRFMGAGPEVVGGWISQMAGVTALPRRRLVQTAASVWALWA